MNNIKWEKKMLKECMSLWELWLSYTGCVEYEICVMTHWFSKPQGERDLHLMTIY